MTPISVELPPFYVEMAPVCVELTPMWTELAAGAGIYSDRRLQLFCGLDKSDGLVPYPQVIKYMEAPEGSRGCLERV